MNKTKEALWNDYNLVSDQLKVINIDDNRYRDLLEERDNIRNELININKATMETDLKKSQIEAENNREKVKNRITIGTFAVSTVVGIVALFKTFKFDETGTVTSTMGRGILNSFIPKGFKR